MRLNSVGTNWQYLLAEKLKLVQQISEVAMLYDPWSLLHTVPSTLPLL